MMKTYVIDAVPLPVKHKNTQFMPIASLNAPVTSKNISCIIKQYANKMHCL